MEATLTIPFELAADIFASLDIGKGWVGDDQQNRWTIGHGIDEETGNEYLQISVKPLLVIAKD